MPKELWTVAQAAEALSVSEDTVRRLIRGGQLPAYQITERTTRLDPLDVYAYFDSRKKKTDALRRKTRVKGPKEVRGGLNNSGYYPGMKVV